MRDRPLTAWLGWFSFTLWAAGVAAIAAGAIAAVLRAETGCALMLLTVASAIFALGLLTVGPDWLTM